MLDQGGGEGIAKRRLLTKLVLPSVRDPLVVFFCTRDFFIFLLTQNNYWRETHLLDPLPMMTVRIRMQLHHTLCGSSAWNGNDAACRHHPATLMQNEEHSSLILHGPLRGDMPHQQHCCKVRKNKSLNELGRDSKYQYE